MKQNKNIVRVTGLIQEMDLKNEPVDGKNTVKGNIVVRVVQDVGNGHTEVENIKVNVYANEMTKANKVNQTYTRLEKLRTTGISIAAANGDDTMASKVSIQGNLNMNRFVPQGQTDIVEFPRIRGAFINEVTGAFRPSSTFEMEILLKDIKDEIVNDVPTGRLTIDGVVVQYGDMADIFTFKVEDENAIDFIKNNWSVEDTVEVAGFIRATVEEVTSEDTSAPTLGFGHIEERVFTRNINEFVITAGSESAIDPDMCNSLDDVLMALQKTKDQEEVIKARANVKKAPSKTFRDF